VTHAFAGDDSAEPGAESFGALKRGDVLKNPQRNFLMNVFHILGANRSPAYKKSDNAFLRVKELFKSFMVSGDGFDNQWEDLHGHSYVTKKKLLI